MWCVISLLWHSSEKYLTSIVSISCSTDFSWISAGEAGRKRWTAPGFSWFRHQHQAGYGACQGLKVWSVISVSVKILWFLGRNQLFWLLVCVLPQVQVDLPFSCLQTSSAFCLGLGGFSISTMWTSTPQWSLVAWDLPSSSNMKKHLAQLGALMERSSFCPTDCMARYLDTPSIAEIPTAKTREEVLVFFTSYEWCSVESSLLILWIFNWFWLLNLTKGFWYTLKCLTCVQETVLHSETRNGEKVQITVTLTNELPPTSPVCLQFYNIIFRRQVLADKLVSMTKIKYIETFSDCYEVIVCYADWLISWK